MTEGMIRWAGLLLPFLALAVLVRVRRPDRRLASAALLATLWNLHALLLVHVMAARLGWWSFTSSGGDLTGLPVDLWLGWSVLWGAVPLLATRRLPLLFIALVAFWLDLGLMPRLEPLLQLGDSWLIGETFAIAIALVPGQLLGRWTVGDAHLGSRSALLVILCGAFTLGLLPAAIMESGWGSWTVLAEYPTWQLSLGLQVLILCALPGVAAVQEFAMRGGGTPLPFDPPRRLVTTGVYAYVANPMQLSSVLVLLVWGALLGNALVAAAGAMAFFYAEGLARWDEGTDMESRYGGAWSDYRKATRRWIPRLRIPPQAAAPPARLYLGEACEICAGLARWLLARQPVGLDLHAAEDHPARDLTRITYVSGEGMANERARSAAHADARTGDAVRLDSSRHDEAEGVAALSRALDHLGLGWALLAAFIRLPGLQQLVQLIADASGGEPRLIPRRPPVHSGSHDTGSARRETTGTG